MSPAETADAVLAFLGTSKPDLGVYEPQNAPVAADPPHVVATFDLGRPGLDRVGGRSRTKVWRILLRVVGSTPNNARWAAGEVYDVFDGGVQVPVPNTRSRTQVAVESSTTVALDDADVPDLYTAVFVLTFGSTPAT